MTPRPSVSALTEELYAACAPLAVDEEANDWPLLRMCAAFASMLDDPYEWTRLGPNDEPPWSQLVDIDRAPDEAVKWLGQLVGVRVSPTVTGDAARDWVRSTDGFKRGSLEAIVGAAQRTLIGGKNVVLYERYDPDNATDDSQYHLTIVTYTAETPDADALVASVLEQKPAGIILHHLVLDGQTWQQIVDNDETWQDLINNYDDWADVAGTF